MALKDEEFALWLDADTFIPEGQDPLIKLVMLSKTGKTLNETIALSSNDRPVIPSILTAECRLHSSPDTRFYDLYLWKMSTSPGSSPTVEEVGQFIDKVQTTWVCDRGTTEGTLGFQGYPKTS